MEEQLKFRKDIEMKKFVVICLLIGIAFFAMLFTFCILQEKNNYQSQQNIVENSQSDSVPQSNPVWKWKTITAEYKGIDCGRIVVYDAEDDMTFKYTAQNLGLGMYLKMKNSPVGTKVKIEVDSLVDESTGEVLQRESYKLWL